MTMTLADAWIRDTITDVQALKRHFFDHMETATREGRMSDDEAWVVYIGFYDFQEPLASELLNAWVARDPQRPELSLASDAPH